MGQGFEVDTDQLGTAAAQLGSQVGAADAARTAAGQAGMSELSWGLLGQSLGLAQIYRNANERLAANLTTVSEYLTWAQQAMESGAANYSAADEAIAADLDGVR